MKTTQTPVVHIVCRNGNDFDVLLGDRVSDRLCFDEMLGQVAVLLASRNVTIRERVGSGTPLYRMFSADELVERMARYAKPEAAARARAAERAAEVRDAARYRRLCQLIGDEPWTFHAESAAHLTEHLDAELTPRTGGVVDSEFPAVAAP